MRSDNFGRHRHGRSGRVRLQRPGTAAAEAYHAATTAAATNDDGRSRRRR